MRVGRHRVCNQRREQDHLLRGLPGGEGKVQAPWTKGDGEEDAPKKVSGGGISTGKEAAEEGKDGVRGGSDHGGSRGHQ